jgi:hypothetical protein
MSSCSTHYYCPIEIKLEFSGRTFEKYSILNFMKICPYGAEFFHANRRTDMTKLIVAFRNFENEPKNENIYSSP